MHQSIDLKITNLILRLEFDKVTLFIWVYGLSVMQNKIPYKQKS